MEDPPVVKCLVRMDIEALFWGRGFCERVKNISSKNEENLTGGDRVEEMGTGLVNAIGVCFI